MYAGIQRAIPHTYDHGCLRTPSRLGAVGGSAWWEFCASSGRGIYRKPPEQDGHPMVLLLRIIQPSPEKLKAHVSILCSCVLVCGYDGLAPGDGRRNRHPCLLQPGQQQRGCRPPGAAFYSPQCVLGRTSFLPRRQGKDVLSLHRVPSVTAWASFPVWKEASGSSGY